MTSIILKFNHLSYISFKIVSIQLGMNYTGENDSYSSLPQTNAELIFIPFRSIARKKAVFYPLNLLSCTSDT